MSLNISCKLTLYSHCKAKLNIREEEEDKDTQQWMSDI